MNHGGLGRDVVVVVAAASVSSGFVLTRRERSRPTVETKLANARKGETRALRRGRSRILRARLRAYRIRTPSIIKKESDLRSSTPTGLLSHPTRATKIF